GISANATTGLSKYRPGNLAATDIPPGYCRRVQRDPRTGPEVAIWPTLGTSAVRFNVERPPFDDRRKRLAIAHAADPRVAVRGLLEDCVSPLRGILPPAMPGYDER